MDIRSFAARVQRSLRARLAHAATDEAGFVCVTPDEVVWEGEAGSIQRTVLAGDPTQPGLYVVRVKFPRGVMTRNHYHREDRHVVVIQGTWYAGTGDEFAPEKTVPMQPGSYMKHPAGAHHFDGAKDEEVIVQISGIGPSDTTRLRPDEGAYGRSLPE